MSSDSEDAVVESVVPSPPPPPPQDDEISSTPIREKSEPSLRALPGQGELVNTSSFAKRIARGSKPLERDQKLLQQVSEEENDTNGGGGRDTPPIDWTDDVGKSLSQDMSVPEDKVLEVTVSRESSNSCLSSAAAQEDNTIDISNKVMRSIQSTPTNSRPPSRTPSLPQMNMSASSTSASTDNDKNALNAFGEYISFFFQRAEVYEEELEVRQSQRNLQLQLDKQRHGVSNRKKQLSPEGGYTSDDDEEPHLTDMGEALAAVDAMSNFRSLTEAKKQLKDEHSFDKEDNGHDIKKQKLSSSAPPRLVEEDEAAIENHREQWKAFINEKKQNKYNEIAIESLALPLTVDEFYHHVLKDDATHSFGKFMCDIGDLNVETTPWDASTSRIIHYTHPVNAPMAPPTAKARKEQSFTKVGSVGLCVETCTIVEEVPMADCFVVEDRLWVNEAEDGEGCIVAVTFQIRFVKGTMFRRIIESTTRGEYLKFFKQFSDMIQIIKSPSAAGELELEEVAMELEEVSSMLEGQEVPLTSVLGRIRHSSRRLSSVLGPSTRKLMQPIKEGETEEKPSIDLQSVIAFIIDGLAYIRKQISESDFAWALAVVVFFCVLFMNVIALRQIGKMNALLYNLDARLETMNEVNALLLSKLASEGNVCEE